MTTIDFTQKHLQVDSRSIKNCLQLLQEGASIPFIARYRKEATKGLDEIQIEQIQKLNLEFLNLLKKQKSIQKTIEERGKLTPELKNKIESCFDPLALEDLYLPFKKSRQTKAEKAKKMGLVGLAKIIMAQNSKSIETVAKNFVKGEIRNVEEAIEGAQFIIAEWMNQHQGLRKALRKKFKVNGILKAKLKEKEKDKEGKFKDYYTFQKPLREIQSHQYLALHRAANMGIISFQLSIDKNEAEALGRRFFIQQESLSKSYLEQAFQEAYKRLLKPSLVNESLKLKKEEADEKAIEVFSKNLRQLLLSAPLGQAKVLAIDPGYKSGCKIVCLNANGELEHNETIYPHPPQKQVNLAIKKLKFLTEAHQIEAFAIGDGTAGRETLQLIKNTTFYKKIPTYLINEDGASVYSASSLARKEFPSYDVTVRGAVSIGRRLMDPLAELVKISPASIGVGQYQHEVDQKKLAEALERVVISCVNQVGVEINTASEHLLSYISGLGPALAKNCIDYRNKIGSFSSIEELKKVPRLGEKAFEQASGFLRVKRSKEILDQTGVHPESYKWVEIIAKQQGLSKEGLIKQKPLLNELKAKDFPALDAYTFNQIIEELKKPGRDPRAKIVQSQINRDVNSINDLKIGQILTGKISNITQFGAFVDLGIKENGLIHKSNLANYFVKQVNEEVSLHQQVRVEIISLDENRKRIGLKRLSD